MLVAHSYRALRQIMIHPGAAGQDRENVALRLAPKRCQAPGQGVVFVKQPKPKSISEM
jgi:hypothetical protein